MRQGDLIAGRYRVVRRVGSGGMGTVYEALDTASNASVALKTLRGGADLEVRARTRLLREAYALAEVRHPAVVRYVDHGVAPELGPFLVMAWVVGETLDERLRASGVTPTEALELVRRLASGLSAVHARGVVHRDLKPSNVMLTAGDVTRAIVVDFGVARLAPGSSVTATGDHVGTPRYMAPEQIRSARSVDDRTDVFALGCVLFECLTGRIAFEGIDPVTVLARILFDPLPVPSSRRADLPPVLDALVARMLDRDPMRRPTAAGVEGLVAEALRALDRESTALGRPDPSSRHDDPGARPLDRTSPWATSDDLAPPSFRVDTMAPLDAARRLLPSMQGAFVGRRHEGLRLLEWLRAKVPLIAVWGGPGIGKTRLVIETVRQAIDQRDPLWDALIYAELGDARDGGDIVRILATAAQVSLESSEPPELALASALGKLGRGLLILDRAEHLAALIGTLVQAFRAGAPRLQVVATSRRKGCPPGAMALELGALPAAGTPGHLSPAAALLLERLGHTSSPETDPRAARQAELIASALEGNPLAIELSAPSGQILGLDGLLARITSAPDGLENGLESVTSVMRGTLERSHDLLSEAERLALAQCAVFRGGFTFEAAEAVVRAPGVPVLALVQALRDHSLVTTRTLEGGEVRLAQPASVRDLAWDRLRSLPDARAVLHRHAAYYAGAHVRSGGLSSHALARLERDADNLLAAAEFSLSEDDGELAAGIHALIALEPVVLPRGAVGGYLQLVDAAIARTDALAVDSPDPRATDLRSIRARLDGPAGRTARARVDLGICLEEARRRKDPHREGLVLLDLGVIHHLDHDWVEARRLYEAAMERLQAIDDPWALGRCLGNIGALRHDDGDLQGAAVLYRQAIAQLEQAGENRQRANFMGNLALLEQELGHRARAHDLFESALVLLEPIRDARLLAINLGNLGVLELELGEAQRAVARHERALALLAGSGDIWSRTLCLTRLAAALAGLDRSALAEARLAQAERLTEGASALLIEIVALARAFIDLASRAIGRPDAGLSAAKLRVDRAMQARHGDRALRDQSDDIRAMLRILARLIAQRENALD